MLVTLKPNFQQFFKLQKVLLCWKGAFNPHHRYSFKFSVGGLPAVYVCLKLSKPHDNASILSMIKGLPRHSSACPCHMSICDTKVWWPGQGGDEEQLLAA